jgi:hypothetical protein
MTLHIDKNYFYLYFLKDSVNRVVDKASEIGSLTRHG